VAMAKSLPCSFVLSILRVKELRSGLVSSGGKGFNGLRIDVGMMDCTMIIVI